MPAGPGQKTLSIRVPKQLREMIAAAADARDVSKARLIAENSATAAHGVLSKGKSLKLLPEWFFPDKSDPKMITVAIDPEDLEVTKTAARRMMIPHTRLVLWAVALASVNTLGRDGVDEINKRLGSSGLD